MNNLIINGIKEHSGETMDTCLLYVKNFFVNQLKLKSDN